MDAWAVSGEGWVGGGDNAFQARIGSAILDDMATSTLIPVSEYLNTTYRPDCDYIDGELRKRNLGERPHSLLQMLLGAMFLGKTIEWDVIPMTEQRVQTSAKNYRIPDVCIVRRGDPADRIVREAPLLCIEIISREDRLREMQERIDDYLGMGVENIWVIDPDRRLGYVGGRTGFVHPPNDVFTIIGTPVRIDLAELFAQLDSLRPSL